MIPALDHPVPPNGYRWWYVDALSDDGRQAITVIAFVGSVFSPFYFRARRQGQADPLAYCAVNVCLYGSTGRWALTERGRASVEPGPGQLRIGPSHVAWNGNCLSFHLDETSAPLPLPIRGVVRVHPRALLADELFLDAPGEHRWRPVAPAARVEVDLEQPSLRWRGEGYLDSNGGTGPMELAFRRWTWSRARAGQATVVYYDLECRDGTRNALALRVEDGGRVERLAPPPRASLPPTPLWRIGRETRADDGRARVLRTLEDTPFYSRSVVTARQGGHEVTALHESLCLDRYARPWVQFLIPYRMRREPGQDRGT